MSLSETKSGHGPWRWVEQVDHETAEDAQPQGHSLSLLKDHQNIVSAVLIVRENFDQPSGFKVRLGVVFGHLDQAKPGRGRRNQLSLLKTSKANEILEFLRHLEFLNRDTAQRRHAIARLLRLVLDRTNPLCHPASPRSCWLCLRKPSLPP